MTSALRYLAEDDCKTAEDVRARAKRTRALFWPQPPKAALAPPLPIAKPLQPPSRVVARPVPEPSSPAPSEPLVAPSESLRVPLSFIIRATCVHFKLTSEEFLGGGRRERYARARRVCIHIAVLRTELSLKQIGLRLGLDHTTVIHARNRAMTLIERGDDVVIEAIGAVLAEVDRAFPNASTIAPPPRVRHSENTQYPKHGLAWSVDEIDFLKEAFRDGKLSNGQISERLSRSPEAVEDKAAKLGLKRPCKRDCRSYTDEELETIARLRSEGATGPMIADQLQRSVNSVNHQIAKIRSRERRAAGAAAGGDQT